MEEQKEPASVLAGADPNMDPNMNPNMNPNMDPNTLFTRLQKVTKCVQTAPRGRFDEAAFLKDPVSGDASPVKATGCRLGQSCLCSCPPPFPLLPLSLFFVGLLKKVTSDSS